jgi:hypothetical protein
MSLILFSSYVLILFSAPALGRGSIAGLEEFSNTCAWKRTKRQRALAYTGPEIAVRIAVRITDAPVIITNEGKIRAAGSI